MDFQKELAALVAAWPQDQAGLCQAFQALVEALLAQPETRLALVLRPGVSHSVRADIEKPAAGRKRPVYGLVDVVTPRQGPWFLSVCFYEDEISDPEERGEAVPRGLYDETGYCFDVEEYDSAQVAYLEARLTEARAAARGR
jgi:hypothetical protein